MLAIAGQVAAGLDAAHARGLVHGDVKPAGVLLEGDHVYVSGFGTAGWRASADYIAPELLDRSGARPSARSDVYSLGCVVYEALTGRPPYLRGDALDTLSAHLHAPLPSIRELRPELPAALADAVGWALDKDPGGRPESAGAFMSAARGALA